MEIQSDAYPGERLMVCHNPRLAGQRVHKREALLQTTETLLEPSATATRCQQRRLTGKERIGERAGRVLGRYKMAKHFPWSIDLEGQFNYRRMRIPNATAGGIGVIRVPATIKRR